MNSWLLTQIVAGLLVVSAVWAANADTNQPAVTQVTLKLTDGGRITGTAVGATLPFHIEYAKTEIPWSAVTGCEISGNAPSVLKLKNGDQLRGRLGLEALKLETSLGKLAIPMTSVTSFDVRTSRSDGGIDGLILYFPFDEDGGDVVRDASGNSNDGKVDGAKFTPDGKIGGAYAFHGQTNRRGTCIQVTNSASLNSPCETKQLTLAVWIKPENLSREYPSIICMGSNNRPDAYGGYEFYIHGVGGEDVRFSSGNCDFITRNSNRSWIHEHIGEWIHLAVTVDVHNKQRAIYVNGAPTNDEYDHEDYHCSIMDALMPVANDLFIGKPDPGCHSNRAGFTGLIDEVMIFNRALSADEVLALYQREGPLTAGAAETRPAAGENAPAIKVRAELVDGSIVVGEVKPEDLTLQSAGLGKVVAPLAQLREIRFAEDGRKVSVRMKNGDLLVGTPLFSGLTVTTAFGRVTLLPAHLRVMSSGVTKPLERKPPSSPRETPAPRRESTRTIEL